MGRTGIIKRRLPSVVDRQPLRVREKEREYFVRMRVQEGLDFLEVVFDLASIKKKLVVESITCCGHTVQHEGKAYTACDKVRREFLSC